ncbi:MAG: DinB family protein [Saprospiraceae bacterium]|nr:DinB family protein [Saprospiraceae bacterium]
MPAPLVIQKPEPDEYPEWYAGEINEVRYDDLLFGLQDSFDRTLPALQILTADDLIYRYAPGKWSIREIWQHVIDVERILCYRALRYARQDATVLSGFDENKYVELGNADRREWPDLLREYSAVRLASIELFKSFTLDMFMYKGTTGRSTASVRAVGYLILGHETHHMKTIRERYLSR